MISYRRQLQQRQARYNARNTRLQNNNAIENLAYLARVLDNKTYDTVIQMCQVMNNVYPNRVDLSISFETKVIDIINENYYPLFIDDDRYFFTRLNTSPVSSRFKLIGQTKIYSSTEIEEAHVRKLQVKMHLNFIIHFPEFTITNSHSEKRVIKDLFVKIPILIEQDGLVQLERLEGVRTTLFTDEYAEGYMHSHLSSLDKNTRTLLSFTTFCTGTGDINMVESLFNQDNDMLLFKNYCLSIIPFLEWESVESTPYIYMSVLADKEYNVDTPNRHIAESVCERIFSYFRRQSDLDLDWHHDGNRFYIVDNGKLEEYLLEHSAIFNIGNYIYGKDADGKYFRVKQSRFNGSIVSSYTILKFQGKDYKLQILEKEKADIIEDNQTKFVHELIVKYVRDKFEQQANKSYIKESGVRRYSTVSH